MGRRERERFRHLETMALSTERRPRMDRDESAAERGVVLLPERGGTCTIRIFISSLTGRLRTSRESSTAAFVLCDARTYVAAYF